MTRSVLGKRARVLSDTEPTQLPSKRTRRTALLSPAENDENRDPAFESANTEATSPAQSLPKPSDPQLQLASSKFIPRTPTNSRFRNALSSSPSSPSTPRHVVKSAGKLFQRLTPQSPLSPSSQTVYHLGRQLFSRGADPGQLLGREEEGARLETFLKRCSTSRPGGCLYVSGPPGTGKSAMIAHVTKKLVEESTVRTAYVNCMSIKSTKDLCQSLLRQLGLEEEMGEIEAMDALQKVFLANRSNAVYLVVLDEVDHILTLGLESLYRVFEWSLQKASRLVMIGIANALDLTDRFLPRLKARNLKPELLPFQPYSATQIRNIISTRLKSLLPKEREGTDFVPFIHPAAIELCSRKVASQTGDIRKAFEICRRALDLVEMETREKHEAEAREEILQQTPSRKALGENNNMASPRKSGGKSAAQSALDSLKALTVESAPRASISHLNKVTAAAFSNGTSHRLRSLNLQQKAALCALMAMEKRNRAARDMTGSSTPSKTPILAPTYKALFDTYCKLCRQDSLLHPLSSSEFREVMGSLETLGLINALEGKTGSLVAVGVTPSKRGRKPGGFCSTDEKRVASCVGEKEIEQVFEGHGSDILRSILEGDALD